MEMNESDEDNRLVDRARGGDAAAAGEALSGIAPGCGGWSRPASTAGFEVGSIRPMSSKKGSWTPSAKLPGYLADPKIPLFLWLRLVDRGAADQDPPGPPRRPGPGRRPRGVAVPGPMPAASSAALAAHLLGKETSPTQAAVRAERLLRLQERSTPWTRWTGKSLSLRHFEELTHAEAARVLEIQRGGRGQARTSGR